MYVRQHKRSRLVNLIPLTCSFIARSTAYHGFDSAHVLMQDQCPKSGLVLPSLARCGPNVLPMMAYVLLWYDGRFSATLTSRRAFVVTATHIGNANGKVVQRRVGTTHTDCEDAAYCYECSVVSMSHGHNRELY